MRKQKTTATVLSVLLFLLIVDAKTVFRGAFEGIELCLYTVIPSLFPFFVICNMLTGVLTGLTLKPLYFLLRPCNIPKGSESLFLLGVLGGYPVGAKVIGKCWENGQLDKDCASRMLGFCSNCGPSFIFGICGSLFASRYIPWYLWLIQIISAWLTGVLLPGGQQQAAGIPTGKQVPIESALKASIRTLSQVCGWVVLFRIVLTLLKQRVLWLLPPTFQVLFGGLLELSNGCISLSALTSPALQFILCSGFLSFGGLCVLMQTASVTGALGLGQYFPGKCIQTVISVALSYITAHFLFGSFLSLPAVTAAVTVFACSVWRLRKKKIVAIPKVLLYNRSKPAKG